MGNETYKIEVGSPLLRPGLSISTEVSKGYVVQAIHIILDKVREYNGEVKELEKAKEKGQLEKKIE